MTAATTASIPAFGNSKAASKADDSQAAAAAKAKRTAEAKAKTDEVKRQKRDFWQQWVATHQVCFSSNE